MKFIEQNLSEIQVKHRCIIEWECHVPSASCPSRAFPCIPVHSRSVSIVLSCSRYFPSPYYYVPYLSPLLLHISISGSGRDELDQQTELSAQSDYILSFYCLCLRTPQYHSVNSVLIVYLHVSPLGSSYCSPPYISPYKP